MLECTWLAKDLVGYKCDITGDLLGEYIDSDDADVIIRKILGEDEEEVVLLPRSQTMSQCGGSTNSYYTSLTSSPNYIIQILPASSQHPESIKTSDIMSNECDGLLPSYNKILIVLNSEIIECIDTVKEIINGLSISGEVVFITGIEGVYDLDRTFGSMCTENCLTDFKYIITPSTTKLKSSSICTSTAENIKELYGLIDEHPCGIEFNGSPCCCSITCLASKTGILDTTPTLNFSGDRKELELGYAVNIIGNNVNSVFVREGILGFNFIGVNEFYDNSEWIDKWLKINPRQYINILIEPLLTNFLTGGKIENVNIVNKTAIRTKRPFIDEPSYGEMLDQVDIWSSEFEKETKAATLAKLQLSVDRDAGLAFEEATRSHVAVQAANLANKEEGQSCLFTDNRNLLASRFVNNVQDGFRPKQSQFDPMNAVQYIPGIGVYRGWYDIVEYSNINSDVNYNNYYHEYLITSQDLSLDDDNANKLTIDQRGVSSWSNGSR